MRKLTAEEEREAAIVALAYEIQAEEDDERDEGLGVFEGPLKEEYYEMAKADFYESEVRA